MLIRSYTLNVVYSHGDTPKILHIVILMILVVATSLWHLLVDHARIEPCISPGSEVHRLQRQGHRKVRRFRHHRGNRVRDVSGSDEESEDDSDDDSDWEESDEESESEMEGYDLDICPPGCDQTLYDAATTMRERRLDCEEMLTEEKKNSEALKKELEALQKKARVIDSSLKTAQNDLEAFQVSAGSLLVGVRIGVGIGVGWGLGWGLGWGGD